MRENEFSDSLESLKEKIIQSIENEVNFKVKLKNFLPIKTISGAKSSEYSKLYRGR